MSPDVEIRLHNYVETQIGIPFEFGVNDCPMFTLGAIDIMLGTDYKKSFVGKWDDQKSAWKYAKKNGGDSYIALSVKDYENLSLNFAELRRYIEQQKLIIVYYEESVSPEKEEKNGKVQ